MRRRELLKATGLAAVADVEAILSEASATSEASLDDVRSRLPTPSETPDGRYDVTLARRLDDDVLQAPDLFDGAETHASIVSARVSATVGLEIAHESPGDALRRRGFEQADPVAGRPQYVRRSRYKQQVAVVDEGTVVLGRGPEPGPVTDLVRTLAVPHSESFEARLPAAATVLDRLGTGAVLSLSPAGRRSAVEGPRPVATGERLSLRAPGGRLRTVAVYESSAASRAALETADPTTSDARITRDGPAVVRDESVPETTLPRAED